MRSVLVGVDDPSFAEELRVALDKARLDTVVCGVLDLGDAQWPKTPDVLVADGDTEGLDVRVLWAGWQKRQPHPTLLVLTATAEGLEAAERVGAIIVSKPIEADRLAREIVRLCQPGEGVVNPTQALKTLGIPIGGEPEDEAAAILAGAARVDVTIIRSALRPLAGLYVTATPLLDRLCERRALDDDEARFAIGLNGARTLAHCIDAAGVAQEHAARLIWALASAGALVTSAEPPLLGEAPMARLTARVRAHLRARGKLRGASAWSVLEVEPGASPEECDHAATMLAVRYAPERTAPFDLGELAELAPLVWRHIQSARETLVDTQKRAAHDLRYPRPGGDALRARREAAAEAADIFVRGHKALLARDAFRAVSELAAAARKFPDEPDYEAYVSWAKVVAEEARKGDVRAAAIKERRQLEDTLWGRRPRPRTCFALGNLCRAGGDLALARLHFQEAVVIDPRFAAAREALAQLPA